jgi:diketogulonate reductase-like aldo/keto reductase
MEHFIVSTAGVRMPRIIFGTAWKKGNTESLVRTAIRLGFRASTPRVSRGTTMNPA